MKKIFRAILPIFFKRYFLQSLFICLLLTLKASGQEEFRLNYDSSSVPELYPHVSVFLEEKSPDGYRRYKGKYKLETRDGVLTGQEFTFHRNAASDSGVVAHFKVTADKKTFFLPLRFPALKDIRFNLYTDSIKPVLNFYVNVEGIFSSGRILPLTENEVVITCSEGIMNGLEWTAPKNTPLPEKIRFTAVYKDRPRIQKTIDVYIKKLKDPRDEEGYEGINRARFQPSGK